MIEFIINEANIILYIILLLIGIGIGFIGGYVYGQIELLTMIGKRLKNHV